MTVLCLDKQNKRWEIISHLFFCDTLDRIVEIQYNIGTNKAYQKVYSYEYNTAGQLHSVTDKKAHEVTVFEYDSAGRVQRSVVFDESERTNLYSSSMVYNDKSQLEYLFNYFDYVVGSGTAYGRMLYDYAYDDDGNISRVVLSDMNGLSLTSDPTYDNFGRVTTKATTAELNSVQKFYNTESYTFLANGSKTTTFVSQAVNTVRASSTGSAISTTT